MQKEAAEKLKDVIQESPGSDMLYMTASTILLLQTYVVPFSSFQEDIKVWDQEEKANLRRQTINPFLDVAGYIWHGQMRVFKKIQKYCFELSATKLFLSMPRRLLNTW